MVQGGVQDSHHFAIKPDLAILPPLDPGTADVMLLLATIHPTENNLYNVVVPLNSRVRASYLRAKFQARYACSRRWAKDVRRISASFPAKL